ncbi:I78 family peptidase inhibitor [Aquipseudomonas alcaligenes]|uniref:Peptidase inhibitor I78 family protein n=1 Tax=Aquipseudomonas alcaligenes TaxID=43263 RepID=A0A1N6V324_AQUAC|nr:I78 family peptidase inhibitor [Pseudomonas alcaligenes]SIQ72169.1 Peptidase inhibitor I78 family protein [Pseudomonas alcaligenes]
MNRILPLSALLAGALLAGCASSPQHDSAKATKGDGRCNAEPVQYLLEERITTDLAERARVESGAAQLRVTHPNQPVTMDYNPQRLNIDIDEDDIIIRLSCG